MTELSYVWDGIATGDATQAPYDRSKFSKYVFYPVAGLSTDAFVVPGYDEDLEVLAAGTTILAVKVRPGAAVIRSFLYISDEEETLNLEALTSSSYCRWDRIILRLDYAAQTVRLAVIKGIESLSYADPVTSLNPLTQIENDIWECELAQIYLLGNTAYVLGELVFDKRKFIDTHWSKSTHYPDNLIKNSEFLAFSGSQTAGVDAPEFWALAGSPTSITSTTALAPATRGRAIACNFSGDTLMTQIMRVDTGNRTFSLKGLIYVTSGLPYLKLTATRANGTLSTTTYLQAFMRPQSTLIEFNKTITFPDTDIVSLTATWYGLGVFNIGQLILVQGYRPGPFRHFHETIMFNTAVTDASWATTAKSDGTTTINTTASFGNLVLKGTKAVILRLKGNDSGSQVPGICNLSAQGYAAPYNTVYGTLEIGSSAADIPREAQYIVPVNQSMYYASSNAPQFRLVVDATGVSTLDAAVEVVGIIT